MQQQLGRIAELQKASSLQGGAQPSRKLPSSPEVSQSTETGQIDLAQIQELLKIDESNQAIKLRRVYPLQPVK